MSEENSASSLRDLAQLLGIGLSYRDVEGNLHQPGEESLRAIIRSLGWEVVTPQEAEELAEAIKEKNAQLPSVVVAWEGRMGDLEMSSSYFPGKMDGDIPCEVELISGEWGGDGSSGERFALRWERREKNGGDVRILRLSSLSSIPFGYWWLKLRWRDEERRLFLLSAPCSVYQGEREERPLRWGIWAPLFALKGPGEKPIGDLSHLREGLQLLKERGGHIWGTLPLLASSLDKPYHPSPYTPLTRLFWNELYLDLEALPERMKCSPSQEPALKEYGRELRKRSRDRGLVDLKGVYQWKRASIKRFARVFWQNPFPERIRASTSHLPDGLLEAYARFRAVQETRGELWDRWEGELKEGIIREGDFPPEGYQDHLYAQVAMAEQLLALKESAPNALYLDLPLGSHRYGFDTWYFRGLFMRGCSVGAPPDPLAPQGQNWGFPPLHPELLRQRGYDYWRMVLAAHMRFAGLLRLDHIMGLHRLFLIPEGMEAAEGVYLHYPYQELYAVLAIESHRWKCEVVGEDLGTVPDEVREEMTFRGVKRLYILPFEISGDGEPPFKPVPAQSVAQLNTHDLHPFAAWWEGEDIDDMVAGALLDPQEGDRLKKQRSHMVGVLSAYLERKYQGDAPLERVMKLLGESPADLVLLNLQDLVGEREPFNRPGTLHPANWRRQFSLTWEEIVDIMRGSPLLSTLSEARQRAQVALSTYSEVVRRKTVTTGERWDREGALEMRKRLKPGETGPSEPVFFLTDDDLYLFNQGRQLRLWEKLGAFPAEVGGRKGCRFAVWAPDATYVSVIGDFNRWDRQAHPLFPHGSSGIWEGFIPGLWLESWDKSPLDENFEGGIKTARLPSDLGFLYKFFLRSRYGGEELEKSDPMARLQETPPRTATILRSHHYLWDDQKWMEDRGSRQSRKSPISIYEVHLGSWRRVPEEGHRWLTYRELAQYLPHYAREMGFTHIELLPVMEHPFYGSWGYQTTHYFAPTSRYGLPEDLKYLIDRCHQEEVGVILDWVPSHFPTDSHSLYRFDGSHLYEHADPRKGLHPDWGSAIFNYGRHEVRSFLLSSALFWLQEFHVDGLRVDAVASMLYLDYSRREGEWVPNQYGGRENLEAIAFLRELNEAIYQQFPDVQTFAEESTSWPMVSRPTYLGGLGFGFKWDMGWMHDTLRYFAKDPIYRRWHHHDLTFRMLYAWHENFVLPLSHDEVVHGKGSLLGKMPGDWWQKFAHLRLLFTYQWTQPGKKLLFMGGEWGVWEEWNHEKSLDWHLLDYPTHKGVQQLVKDLNRLYRTEPALHEGDCEPWGFEWVDCSDAESSVLVYLRWAQGWRECLLVVLNFTPVVRAGYRVGVPYPGVWEEMFNSDSQFYGGSNVGNGGWVRTTGAPHHNRPDSLLLTLPPLGGVILKWRG